MIERGWYDRAFIRAWSNGPLLVRADTGRLLRESDLARGGSDRRTVAWDTLAERAVAYDPASGRYDGAAEHLALEGEYQVASADGMVACRPVFDHYARLCRKYSPDVVEATCWLPRAQVEEAARLIWQARPTSYYAWSGHEHHANTTETARGMALLYALTGCFDAPGGNVLLPAIPSASIIGEDLPAAKRLAPAIGVAERPLGPARFNAVSTHDFYRAVLDGTPYPVRGLIGFGYNQLLAQADPVRGRAALCALDFYAHADLFMTPTAALADIVLPVASCFEREALKIGFEIDAEAQSLVQLRRAVVPARGEARADTDVIFDLAVRLGLGEAFWNGDVDAAYRHQLGPSGVTLEELRAEPAGTRVALTTRHGKHAEIDAQGNARGFATPSRKIEFWSYSHARSRPCSAKVSIVPCRACASARAIRRSTCIRTRRRRAASVLGAGCPSKPRPAACGHGRGSTTGSIRASSSASTAGGSTAMNWALPATTRSVRPARISI